MVLFSCLTNLPTFFMNQKPIGSSNSSERSSLNLFYSPEKTSKEPISVFGRKVSFGETGNKMARKVSASFTGAGSSIIDQVRKISLDSDASAKIKEVRENQAVHKARGEGELVKLYGQLRTAISKGDPYAQELFQLLIEGEKNLLKLQNNPDDRSAKVQLMVVQARIGKFQEECFYVAKHEIANIADQSVDQFREKIPSFELTPAEMKEVEKEVENFSTEKLMAVQQKLVLKRQESHRAAVGPEIQELYQKRQEAEEVGNHLAVEVLDRIEEARDALESHQGGHPISEAGKMNLSEKFIEEDALRHREQEIELFLLGRKLTLLKGILTSKDPKDQSDCYALRQIEKTLPKIPMLSEREITQEELMAISKSDQNYLSSLTEEGIIAEGKKES